MVTIYALVTCFAFAPGHPVKCHWPESSMNYFVNAAECQKIADSASRKDTTELRCVVVR